MKRKQKMVVPCVTTMEAVYGCLKHKVPAFCIEQCLYKDFYKWIRFDLRFICYKKRINKDLQIIILEKTLGKNSFDSSKYELVYPAF